VLEPDPLLRLRESRLMRTDAEVAQFIAALDELADRRRQTDLPGLHQAFDDQTKHGEVMWSLVHLIEDFDCQAAAIALVAALPEMTPTARDWMKLLVIRTLNSDEARPLLMDAYRTSSRSEQDALRGLVAAIADFDNEAPAPVASRARAFFGATENARRDT
jgi:hypothetical protein